MSWYEATTEGRTWTGSQRTAAACSVRLFILKLLLHSWLLSLLWPNHKKMRQKRMLTAVFLRQNINSRTSQSSVLAVKVSTFVPLRRAPPSPVFLDFLSCPSTHAFCQSERSSLSETTPPPCGEVWVSPETTERLFLQHSWTMTGPPLWAAAYPEKGKKKGFF